MHQCTLLNVTVVIYSNTELISDCLECNSRLIQVIYHLLLLVFDRYLYS